MKFIHKFLTYLVHRQTAK